MTKTMSADEIANMGGKVTTRDGRPVKIIRQPQVVDLGPLVAVIENLVAQARANQGQQLEMIRHIGTMCAAAIPLPPEPARQWEFIWVRDGNGMLKKIIAKRID